MPSNTPHSIDLDTPPIEGVWANAAGSRLVLSEQAGALSGIYRTAIGAADLGRDYPLTGWRNGRCVGFTVSWGPDSDSVTAWTGLMHDDGGAPALHTVWVLVRGTLVGKTAEGFAEREAAPWEAFSVQTSIFRRS